jgi:superfamily II DNA/RNA helicase
MGRTRRIALACFRSGTNRGKYSRDSGSIQKPAIGCAYFVTGQKLVIFTEHRDTLSYLEQRVSTLLGRKEAIVSIHGGIEARRRTNMQEAFKHDPDVQVLIATDAAGEGINLQRAHLMVVRPPVESQSNRAAIRASTASVKPRYATYGT